MDYFTNILLVGLLIGFVKYLISSQKKKEESITKNENITNCEDYYLFKKGKELYKQEKYSEAVEKFSEAIAIKRNPEYFNNRGCALLYMHENMRAIWDFSAAISLSPKKTLYYEHRAMTYFYESCHSQCFDDYKQAMVLGSEHSRLKLKEYFGVTAAWMPCVKIGADKVDDLANKDEKEVCFGFEQLIKYHNESTYTFNLN